MKTFALSLLAVMASTVGAIEIDTQTKSEAESSTLIDLEAEQWDNWNTRPTYRPTPKPAPPAPKPQPKKPSVIGIPFLGGCANGNCGNGYDICNGGDCLACDNGWVYRMDDIANSINDSRNQITGMMTSLSNTMQFLLRMRPADRVHFTNEIVISGCQGTEYDLFENCVDGGMTVVFHASVTLMPNSKVELLRQDLNGTFVCASAINTDNTRQQLPLNYSELTTSDAKFILRLDDCPPPPAMPMFPIHAFQYFFEVWKAGGTTPTQRFAVDTMPANFACN